MKHYQIIQNEEILQDFVDNYLPNLEQSEAFYVALFARRKYAPEVPWIKSDKAQLRRFTSTKERLIGKIRQLQVPVGAFNVKGVDIPQEALALYITINPRCFKKATKNALIKFAHLVTQEYNGYNPHQEVYSEIHKAKSYTYKIDFDFDGIDGKELMAHLNECINPAAYDILSTRGGYHVLVNPNIVADEYRKTFYQRISNHPACDVKGDNMIPVPGCVQGDFVPYFVA